LSAASPKKDDLGEGSLFQVTENKRDRTGGGWRQREFFDSIRHFDQQAREFHRRVESGQADPQLVRDEARHLLEDARRADSDMRQSNAFPEVWDEWRGAMQVLERILNLVGA
jgi:predicted dehydrogenase